MVNVFIELKSAPLTAPYAASYPTQDNLAADWSGDTRLYLDALPSGFEQAIEYFETNKSEIEKAFRGKFVAIWENTIIDSDADFSELAARIYGQLGYVPIYIPFVGRKSKVRPQSRTETVPLLLTQLAKVLPRRMSKAHVDQLRMRFPQPPATDDPATYEFETHQD